MKHEYRNPPTWHYRTTGGRWDRVGLAACVITGLLCLSVAFCGCATPKQAMRELVVTEQIAAANTNRTALTNVPPNFYREVTLTVTVHLCGPGRFADELKRRDAKPNSISGFLEHGNGDHIWIQGGTAYGDMFLPQRDLGHELGHAIYYQWGLPSSRMDHLYE